MEFDNQKMRLANQLEFERSRDTYCKFCNNCTKHFSKIVLLSIYVFLSVKLSYCAFLLLFVDCTSVYYWPLTSRNVAVSPQGSFKLDFWNVSPRLGLEVLKVSPWSWNPEVSPCLGLKVQMSRSCLSLEVGKFWVSLTLWFLVGPLFKIDRWYAYGVIKT